MNEEFSMVIGSVTHTCRSYLEMLYKPYLQKLLSSYKAKWFIMEHGPVPDIHLFICSQF